MQTEQKHRFPEGPPDAFDPRQDLLVWLENNFQDLWRYIQGYRTRERCVCCELTRICSTRSEK